MKSVQYLLSVLFIVSLSLNAHKADAQYQKSLDKFLIECYSLYKMIDFTNIKCLIIASPGFVNEQYFKYLNEATQNEADKGLRKNL